MFAITAKVNKEAVEGVEKTKITAENAGAAVGKSVANTVTFVKTCINKSASVAGRGKEAISKSACWDYTKSTPVMKFFSGVCKGIADK